MYKIGIGIPCPDRVHPDFMVNLVDIIQNTKHKVIVEKETGVRTDRNRNVLLQKFIKAKVDYILWLDADMIYPSNIIETYLAVKEADVIGCLYFKRERPHLPIGYVDSKEKEKPYRPILPQLVHFGEVYPVIGLGFGGMMIKLSVYYKLKKKKWMNYGRYFHIPEEERNQKQKTDALTHDLNFCKNVINHGIKIYLHGSVRPSHIGDKFITEDDYQQEDNIKILRYPKVLVIMPTTNKKQAEQTAKILKIRAGMPFNLLIVLDKDKKGFIKTINDTVKLEKFRNHELFVYTAQDVFVSKNWLIEAILYQAKSGAGLTAFNDGKWNGTMAQFGMVKKQWIDTNFNGNVFPPCYHSNYADIEISQVAKQQRRFGCAEKAIMMEIDFEKDFEGKVNKEDKKLFNKRKKKGFDNKVKSKELIEEFI